MISKKAAGGVKLTGRVTLNEEPVRQGFVMLDALRGKSWVRLGRAAIDSDAAFSAVFRQPGTRTAQPCSGRTSAERMRRTRRR